MPTTTSVLAGRAKQRDSNPSTNMAVRLLQWNANGILAHCQEFQQSLATHNFDIICIQESFLKPDKDYCPTGYNSVRSDRPTAKGGLVTFIRNGLIYTEARRPADMECQAVNVRTSLGTITVINVYVPPIHDDVPPPFDDLFQQNNTVIIGDMNARNRLWGSNTNDARGRALEDAIIAHGYVVLNTGVGTYQTYRGSMTHIDVSLASSQLATKCRWATFNNTMGSDHVPIIITINARPERQRIAVPKWKSAEADWNVFRDCINDQINTTDVTDDDVDQLNSKIVDIIRSAAEQSIPRTKPSVCRRQKPLPYWNDEIKMAVRNRNRARRKMNRTRNINDCIEYRRLKSIAQRVIRSAARGYWQSFCDRLTNQSRLTAVWNMAKKMNGTKSNPTSTSLVDNGSVVEFDNGKAEVFARAFANVSSSTNYTVEFQRHKNDIEQNHAYLFANDAPVTEMSEHLNKEFAQLELNLAIQQLKKNSAPGEDQITYEFFQQIPETGRFVILRLFNAIWRRSRLPKAWKHAIVIPILKSGKDPHRTSSYRPISLTSTLSKLMERLVTNRLMWYLEKFNLLSNTQCGFRRGRSTADHIVRLQDLITRHQHNKGYVLAVFVDFERAFDMVWRKGLLIKLKEFGINGRMFDWIADFTTDRTFQVRVGDALSAIYTLENGTNQGSMISPELFISMIDDLPNSLQRVETSLFADDSSLYKGGRSIKLLQSAVQQDLDALQQWCDKWGFKISTEKTVAVLFSQATQRPDIKLHINGKPIKAEKSARFLGVVFDQHLTWSEHIDYVTSKCSKRLNLMRAISGTRWGATTKSLITIYRALIRSVLDYGATAYDSASNSQLQKLDRIQYSALKLCCGAMTSTSASALQVECGEAPLRLRRLQQQIKFAVKVKATTSHIAKNVFDDHWTTHYGRFSDNKKPLALKVNQFFEDVDMTNVKGHRLGTTPPWLVALPEVDRSLTLEVSKNEAPNILVALSRDKIDQEYSQYVQIYTDASKNPSGKVGIGCYIRSFASSPDIEMEARLTDDVAVQTGEMVAIKMALENICQLEQTTTHRRYAIFTDSLSTIDNLASSRSRSRPNLLSDMIDLLHNINSQITVVWVPSHIGITGNERADQLANMGSKRQHIDIDVGVELQEMYGRVDTYINKLWQEHWNNQTTGRHLYNVQPDVVSRERILFDTRSVEVLAHRLRLGKCRLNYYLHKIALHDTGTCDSCGQAETIEHYLINCSQNEIAPAVKNICDQRKISYTLPTILSQVAVLEELRRLTHRQL